MILQYIDIPLGLLSCINLAIMLCWVYFAFSITRSIKCSPQLNWYDKCNVKEYPRISIIVPVRNEKDFVLTCLESLLEQDYHNFELIAVNDSSTDNTLQILQSMSKKYKKLVIVDSPPKPRDWIGKNWACYQGYLKSRGEFILFTDADTVHSNKVLRSAVNAIVYEQLDAISLVPRLICKDFITKVTLPVLSVFLHSRYSPVRVNNTKNNFGYFFGSFYLISREAYERVGTHKSVKEDIVEDGALGRKVKLMGFRIKLARAEKYLDAVWARNPVGLWHALSRLILPLFKIQPRSTILLAIAVFFLLFEPFLTASTIILIQSSTFSKLLLLINSITILLIAACCIALCKFCLFQKTFYGFGCPVGCTIIAFGFLNSIFNALNTGKVNWRDREYFINSRLKPIKSNT
jgi:glycosyltransferase involved in cell wall biosynthesis